MPPAIPRATYRVQLTADFTFDAAASLVPYLKELGISHLYASPFLKARPGSRHGYDITDHNAINPEFGGDAGFERLSGALARADMGLILDFVPNHMGIAHADNAWWLDVLEWGPRSPFAPMFDIDWQTLPYRHHGGLLLPVLGKPYGDALEGGEIELRFDREEGSFAFWYFEHRLPVQPSRYAEIIRTAVSFARTPDGPGAGRLQDIAQHYDTAGQPSRERAPELKKALADARESHDLLADGLQAYRADQAHPARTTLLHRLLERQHYRLAHWRVAISEINYRRFFDVNELAGIRVEDPKTFELIHRKVGQLIAAGKLHGLRLDHIDGLYDPAQYCLRLQRLANTVRGGRSPFYIVVEKILAPDEPQPMLPGVAGTTGYDALNLISRVLADDAGLPVLESAWQTSAAPSRNYVQIADDAKRLVIETTLASEFTVLVRLLSRIAAGHWSTRDFTQDRLRLALELYVLQFPVYRTYIAGRHVSERDRKIITAAINAAKERWYGSDVAIFEFLRETLTLELVAPGRSGYSATRVKRFVAKLQQFTGPVTAKAIEDTTFYRYHRLLAFNEVGNEPALPALSVEEFHTVMAARAQNVPHAMVATATHDTKRGEDARMRLLALTELAADWATEVKHWRDLNDRLIAASKTRMPSRAHEYMIYQALLGAWEGPAVSEAFVARIKAYALKAAREGKQESSWTNPNEIYEGALEQFIDRLLNPEESAEFIAALDRFAQRLSLLGSLNSLSQLALKCTIPGIPDFYQGTEFWDLSLVDPDNRRPVDFAARQRMNGASGVIKPAPRNAIDAADKMVLTRRLLQVRKEFPDIFAHGRYEPIEVAGDQGRHVIAFARIFGEQAIVVAVLRYFSPLTNQGEHFPRFDAIDATLSLGKYAVQRDLLRDREFLPGDTLTLSNVFDMPAAVLLARVR